jgi:hypothetical protein
VHISCGCVQLLCVPVEVAVELVSVGVKVKVFRYNPGMAVGFLGG